MRRLSVVSIQRKTTAYDCAGSTRASQSDSGHVRRSRCYSLITSLFVVGRDAAANRGENVGLDAVCKLLEKVGSVRAPLCLSVVTAFVEAIDNRIEALMYVVGEAERASLLPHPQFRGIGVRLSLADFRLEVLRAKTVALLVSGVFHEHLQHRPILLEEGPQASHHGEQVNRSAIDGECPTVGHALQMNRLPAAKHSTDDSLRNRSQDGSQFVVIALRGHAPLHFLSRWKSASCAKIATCFGRSPRPVPLGGEPKKTGGVSNHTAGGVRHR